jgi:hypothetical protein
MLAGLFWSMKAHQLTRLVGLFMMKPRLFCQFLWEKWEIPTNPTLLDVAIRESAHYGNAKRFYYTDVKFRRPKKNGVPIGQDRPDVVS